MAAANPTTETDICNLAFARVGSKTITTAQFVANTEILPVLANRHYAQTRDSLLRSHWWRFAKARSALTATTAVAFEWVYAFTLPTDFLREKSVFEANNTISKNTVYSYEIEGSTLLTDESSCNLRYIKQVTAVASFDPLFIEVFVLLLGMKFSIPLAGVGRDGQALRREIKDDLYGVRGRPGLMSKVRAIDRYESERIGRSDRPLWNNARLGSGRIPSQMGS